LIKSVLNLILFTLTFHSFVTPRVIRNIKIKIFVDVYGIHFSKCLSSCFQWAEVDVLDRLPFLFENLRTLIISVDFTEMFAILSFFCLLRSAPVLEELIVCVMSNYHLLILSSITL